MGKQLIIPTGFEVRNTTINSSFFTSGFNAGYACIVAPTETALSAGSGNPPLNSVTLDFATDITNGVIPFQILWKKASFATTSSVISTPRLTLNELVSYKKIVYNPGTKQVTKVNITVPDPQLTGDTYRLKIVNTTPGTASLTTKAFEVVHTGTNFSETTLAAAFVALINASAAAGELPFLYGATPAANSSGVLAITAAMDYHFRLAYDGEAPGTIYYTDAGAISGTADAIPSTNTGTKIKALETELKSHGEGITNKVLYPVKDYTYEASTGTNYDLGIFNFKLGKPAKHGMSSVNYEDYTLYIAETASSATLTDLIIAAANTLYDQGA